MDSEKRRRNISWDESIDSLAERLAAERGLFSKGRGGVSELLEQLVREESQTPRLHLEEPSAGYKAQIRQSEKLGDSILRKESKEATTHLASPKKK